MVLGFHRLAINGLNETSNQPLVIDDVVLVCNGEIYNYLDFGNYKNDIEFVHDAVEHDITQLKNGWGPWAWAWTNNNTVLYATDPQGERALYQYQDDNILIVCSEVAPILEYITKTKVQQHYATRHWAILVQTPWQGITRVSPGELYQDGVSISTVDSVFDWIQPTAYTNIDHAYEEFRVAWKNTLSVMTPTCPTALTYSGGLDSSIILSHVDNLELYTANMIGKDPIADNIQTFLTPQEISKLQELRIDPEQWAEYYQEVLVRTQMPVQSWSFVGQWAICKACDQRVLFTGAGADELFGGYDTYRTLDYRDEYSVSPYSHNGDNALWQQCLSAYDGHAGQATLLMDYWYQIAGCDARGIDVISGAWGIEARNPFLAKPIMQLALNLPFKFKVDTVSKPLIRRLFLERWQHKDLWPKKGFTGHCNDSLAWLHVNTTLTGQRDRDWQQIVLNSFYNSPN
jgi:asparagine synthetase B (glutamine-hydrolysing)